MSDTLEIFKKACWSVLPKPLFVVQTYRHQHCSVAGDLFLSFSFPRIICHPSSAASERNLETGNIRSKEISAGSAVKFLKLQLGNGTAVASRLQRHWELTATITSPNLSAFLKPLFSSILLQSVCGCVV